MSTPIAQTDLQSALSQATADARKMLVVTSPSNPLSAFQAVAKESGLAVKTVSLADANLTAEKLNLILNQPTGSEVSYLVLDGLDSASDEVKQEIEDALQGRAYLNTPELWRLPRLAGTGAHTPHWLPAELRTEVAVPVQGREAQAPKAVKI